LYRLYVWGYNYNGQLGVGNTGFADVWPPILLNLNNSVTFTSRIYAISGNEFTAFHLPGYNQMWMAGNNWNGALGINDTTQTDFKYAQLQPTYAVYSPNAVKFIKAGSRSVSIVTSTPSQPPLVCNN